MRFIYLVFYPFSSQLTIELELVKCFLLNEQKNATPLWTGFVNVYPLSIQSG